MPIRYLNRYAYLSTGGGLANPARAPQSAWDALASYLEGLPYVFWLNLDGEITELSEGELLDLLWGTTGSLPNVLVDYCGYPMYYYGVQGGPSGPQGPGSPDPARFGAFARDLTGGVCAVSSLPDRGSTIDVFIPLVGSGYPYPRGLSVNADLTRTHNAAPAGSKTGFVVNLGTAHSSSYQYGFPQYTYSSFAIVVGGIPRYFYCYGANRFGWPAGPSPYAYALFMQQVVHEFSPATGQGGAGSSGGPPSGSSGSTGGTPSSPAPSPLLVASVLALGGAAVAGGFYLLRAGGRGS